MLTIKDRNGRGVSLRSAIEGSLDERSYGSGTVEGLRDDVNALQRMLAHIVDKLHDKGSMSDADVVDLINWRYSVSDETGTVE